MFILDSILEAVKEFGGSNEQSVEHEFLALFDTEDEDLFCLFDTDGGVSLFESI